MQTPNPIAQGGAPSFGGGRSKEQVHKFKNEHDAFKTPTPLA